MNRKFTLCIAIMLCLFANLQVFGQQEVVWPVSLNSVDWDTSSKGSGADVYNEDDALVLEIMSTADVAWQGIGFFVIDLDLDVYPNGRVITSSESSSQWSVKLFAAGMDDQAHALGGDQSAYGEKTFTVGDITGQSGVSSFELWLWGIGKGQRVIFNKMEFYGEGNGNSVDVIGNNPCIFHAEKGKLVFDKAFEKPVAIYTIEGKLVKQFKAYTNASVDLAKGLYVVKAGTKVVKTIVP